MFDHWVFRVVVGIVPQPALSIMGSGANSAALLAPRLFPDHLKGHPLEVLNFTAVQEKNDSETYGGDTGGDGNVVDHESSVPRARTNCPVRFNLRFL